MNTRSEGIEQRLCEEAERFLDDPPTADLLRALRIRQQRRECKRVAFVVAGLLLMFVTLAGYRFWQRGPTLATSPQAPWQSNATDVNPNDQAANRDSAQAPARAATDDHDLPTLSEAVHYDSLTPAEQFAVRRFLETETGWRSTELQEISL
jgi:hypothetical protein